MGPYAATSRRMRTQVEPKVNSANPNDRLDAVKSLRSELIDSVRREPEGRSSPIQLSGLPLLERLARDTNRQVRVAASYALGDIRTARRGA